MKITNSSSSWYSQKIKRVLQNFLRQFLSKYLRLGWAALTNFSTFIFINKVNNLFRITTKSQILLYIIFSYENFLNQIEINENKAIKKVSIEKVKIAFLMPVHHDEIFTSFLIKLGVWSKKYVISGRLSVNS